ncbi:hypothetical protein [Candidatus Poriferisodalis sp.]|uniref:hypothetical protein n=1 Tax=Candidatus Poriferisodalis sp. TaxID=3101277 RepID=UPI003B52B8DF
MRILRWLPRLVIPLLIAAALVIDARIDRDPPAAAADGREALTRVVVPPPDALTSSWFCPVVGMRDPVRGFGETTTEVLLTNMTGATASVSVELRGRTTGRQFVMAEVAPQSTGVVNTSDYARDEVIGALVEASVGGLAVTRRFVSPLGVDEARCSSVLAPNWYVPVGDTQTDALGLLAIMNPLPRDAIVDVTFASEAEFGPFVAPALTGVVVPAWSTVVVDVGEHARRRDVVAASVRARTGRVAVDSFVAYDGSIGRRGFAAELASVNLGGRWLVPVAGIDDETHLWVRVFNPSDEVAEVAASVVAEGFAGDRVAFAVASHDVTELTISSPGELAPGLDTLLASPGLPFGISVVSQNDVPIVVWAETLVGIAASPLTDIARASDPLDAATESVSEISGGESSTVVAQTDDSASAGTQTGDPESDDVGAEAVVEIRPPVLGAQSGLAFVPGIVQTSDRWLVVVGPEPGAEAFLTIMVDPAASAAQSADPDADPAVEGGSDRRVVVGTLNGETVAVIDVPASGVVTHRLGSGTTRLLASDTPFAVLLWQSRIGGIGLSVAHPLRW